MTSSYELTHRQHIWKHLLARGGPDNVAPGLLRELGIFGGAQGIWVDVKRTRSLTAPHGVAVGLLHTGSSYADDLDDSGMLYHYPRTKRPGGRDQSEVEATKAARSEGVPVFVITHSVRPGLRDVRLAWVQDWDDARRLFIVFFGKDAPAALPTLEVEDHEPFMLAGPSERRQGLAAIRPGQATFKFRVMRRYPVACAVCGIAVPELLDAAHMREKRDSGSDDPRNGILLCTTHHRAFDRLLFAIEPSTLRLTTKQNGPTLSDLRITVESLSYLTRKPHNDAVRWRWERWLKSNHGDRNIPTTFPSGCQV